MADTIKRPHYFDHQFLRETDFTAEQEYHMGMRRRHNRLLHTVGIAEGLNLSFASGASRVTISAGTAVDGQGREIVLPENTQTVDLSGRARQTVFITIAYDEQQTDATSETGVSGNTRWTEMPVIEVAGSAPADPAQKLILGRVTVGTDGTITRIDDGEEPNRRRIAGVAAGDLDARSLALADPGVASTQWPRLRLGAPNRADLQSNLLVNGNIIVGGTVNGRDVAADGGKLDAHVGLTSGNPHGTTAAQVQAVPTSGGTISGNLQVNGTIGVSGTVDGRDVAADGAKLDAHVGLTAGNPHGTTAAQVGAVSTSGGSITGRLDIQRAANAPKVALGRLVAGNIPEAGLFVEHSGPGPAIGLFLFSTNQTIMTNIIHGQTTFVGPVTFSGGKTGYVVDRFVNHSGATLRTGDAVKLADTPIVRFTGDLNKIPIPAVTLADKENDPAVIGVVDREAIPDLNQPDTRTEPEDPTSIPDGGDVWVVTLGTYAHCKVDATEAPIAVGDLLTSSATPGHARKATNPQIGSIIGKALEPLQEGTGYIAVFVNIQ